MDIRTEKGLKDVFNYLESGNPVEARKIIQNLFMYDYSSPELVFTSDISNLWLNVLDRVSTMEMPFEKGEALLAEWKDLIYCMENREDYYQPAMYAVCRGFFPLHFRTLTDF